MMEYATENCSMCIRARIVCWMIVGLSCCGAACAVRWDDTGEDNCRRVEIRSSSSLTPWSASTTVERSKSESFSRVDEWIWTVKVLASQLGEINRNPRIKTYTISMCPRLSDQKTIILALDATQTFEHHNKADNPNATPGELPLGGDAPDGGDETRIDGVPVPEHLSHHSDQSRCLSTTLKVYGSIPYVQKSCTEKRPPHPYSSLETMLSRPCRLSHLVPWTSSPLQMSCSSNPWFARALTVSWKTMN